MSESLESRTQIQDGGLALASLMIIWAFPLAHFTSANSLINRQLKRYNYENPGDEFGIAVYLTSSDLAHRMRQAIS